MYYILFTTSSRLMEAGSDHRPPYPGGKDISGAFELPILTSLLDGVANRQLHAAVGVVTREPLLCTLTAPTKTSLQKHEELVMHLL